MSFSVVIPTYNRADLLPFCLDGVLAQVEPATDVVVVDNGSTDNTRDVVAPYTDRLAYHRTETPGVQAARNLGVELTRGDWIAFLDSDDVWQPDHLRRLGALIRTTPDLTLVFANFRHLRGVDVQPGSKFDDAPAGWWDSVIAQRLAEGWLLNDSITAATLRFHPIFPSALAICRDMFLRLGGFDVGLRGRKAEDGPLFTRCLALGRTGAVPEPTVLIRRHSGNDSVDESMADKLRLLVDETANLRYLRDTFPEMVPLRDAIDQEIVVRSKLAAEAAFAIGDHARMREILRAVPLQARDRKLALKVAVAALPDPVALPLNRLLQGLAKLRA